MKKLKEIYTEAYNENDTILVPQIGQYTYGTLKQNIIDKLEDLIERAKVDNFQSIGDVQLEVFAHFWRAITAYQKHQEPPFRTKITK